MDSPPRILVAGAGPSGLYAALTLLKNGINVRIVDKELKYHTGARGAGMFPRTLELMQMLGIVDDVRKKSHVVPLTRSYTLGPPETAKVIKTWNFVKALPPTPSCPYGTVASINQFTHEGVLRDQLRKLGIEVEMGTELVGLEQGEDYSQALLRHKSEDGTITEEKAKFDYILGADGAKGTVRKLLGLQFEGETKSTDYFAVADIETHQLTTDHCHYWENRTDQQSTITFARPWEPNSPTVHKFSFFIMAKYTEDSLKILDSEDGMLKMFRATTGRTDINFENIYWQAWFRPNMRMVNKFRDGRIFVIGDAAHIHSPTGGQGLNSCMHDAVNLGWKLSLVVKKLAPPSLLDTYGEERAPIIREMLNKTSALYNQSHKEVGRANTSSERVAWNRGGSLFMLGINYRWSSIVLEERDEELKSNKAAMMERLKLHAYDREGDEIRAGDRAPDAPDLLPQNAHGANGDVNKGVSLFNVFTITKHTVLIFAAHDDPIIGAIHTTASAFVAFEGGIQVLVISRVSLPESHPGAEAAKLKNVTLLVDSQGHAHEGYNVEAGKKIIFVIRPDGYVGAVTYDQVGVEKYLDGVLLRKTA